MQELPTYNFMIRVPQYQLILHRFLTAWLLPGPAVGKGGRGKGRWCGLVRFLRLSHRFEDAVAGLSSKR